MNDKLLPRKRSEGSRNRPSAPTRISINPYYIGSLGLLVAAVFVVWSFFGFRTFRLSLMQAVDRESRALLESLVQATEVTARANQFIRLQQIQTLSDKASLVAAEVAARRIDFRSPQRFLDNNDLDGIAALDSTGELLATPATIRSLLDSGDPEVADAIDNVRRDLAPWETLIRADTVTGEEWIGALAGGGASGSVYFAWKKATRLEELYRDIGIGRLIQMMGQETGINYILLQTPEGILLSSRDVKPVIRIASDPFLVAAIAENTTATRELVFEGQEVLEAVRPFISEHLTNGIIRVGLNLHEVRRAESQLRRQLVISSLFLGLLTLAGVAFVVVRQSLAAVSRSYAQISTLTGRILDAMDGAVVAVDSGGNITHFNPAAERLFARRAADVLGAAVADLFPADEAGLDAVGRGGEPVRARDWVRTVEGRPQFLSVSASPIRPGGAVAVIVDQTQARKMAERVRRAERLSELGTMAAGVAHEVRNPLNAIALAAQRLTFEFEVHRDAPEFHQITGAILSETRRLDRIIDDFLDLARPPREAPAQFALAEVINEVAALQGLEAAGKGIAFSISGDPDIGLFGVPGELKKAVINVLSNAIAATSAGGSIGLQYFKAEGTPHAVIRVIDTGVGIPPEHRDKIFQPYFTTKQQGTGLGLAITARVIADFGGSIDLESEPGRGTTVEMRLPLVG